MTSFLKVASLMLVFSCNFVCHADAQTWPPENNGVVSGLFDYISGDIDAKFNNTNPVFPAPFVLDATIVGSQFFGFLENPQNGQVWLVVGNWGPGFFEAGVFENSPSGSIVGHAEGRFDRSKQILESAWYIFDEYVDPPGR